MSDTHRLKGKGNGKVGTPLQKGSDQTEVVVCGTIRVLTCKERDEPNTVGYGLGEIHRRKD